MNLKMFSVSDAGFPESIRKSLSAEMGRTDLVMLILLWAHAPVVIFLAPIGYGTWPIAAAGSAAACILGSITYAFFRGTFLSRIIMSNLLAVYSATLIMTQLGRIEMHFHVFGSIAFLAMYKDWRVLLAPAPLVVFYHTALNNCQVYNVEWLGIPLMVFNYGTGLDIVLLHATFVVFETSVLVYYAATFRTQFIHQMHEIEEKSAQGSALAERASDISRAIQTSADQVSEASTKVTANAGDQAASFEEISATLEELNAGMESMTESTRTQNSNLAALQDQLDELRKSAASIENIVTNANTSAATARAEAARGQDLLQVMVDSMAKIQSNTTEVNSMVDIINEIADRVNLLSLNASIEAARAGDSGRGFGVVAQEIAKLADRTAQSVVSIRRLSQESKGEVMRGRENVDAGVRMLQQLIARIHETSAHMTSVNEVVKLQDHARNAALHRISQISGDVKNFLSTLEEQTTASRSIQAAVVTLGKNGEELAATSVSFQGIVRQCREQSAVLARAVQSLVDAEARSR